MSITSVANDLVTSISVINALKPLPPTISGYSVGGVDDTALDPAGGQTVQINGTGFLAGATITFDGSAVAVVTYVNSNQLTFTSPAKSAGTYTIYVVNADGGTAIYIPGIIYSVLPTWTTSAGTLGSYYETTSISNTVVASGDAPITYALYSGSLPAGSTLYANGVITGTAPVDSSSTTYSFTIQATDAQLQDSTRSFSLTINVDAVTWVTPSSGATYTNAVNTAIANVALSATDAAGYTVSYSANALPTGLTLTGSNISGTPTVIADSSTLLTATAATTTRSAVRTINWSITVANDVYFEYNTLLIPGASTTFVDDASTNNFAVTIAGDTKPNSMNPYTPGYYSNYFDGTGDYISVPDNVAFTMGAGDFTLEAWVYLTTSGASRMIFGTCDAAGNQGSMSYVLLVNSSNNAYFAVGYQGTLYGSTNTATVPTNQWVHIAGVRSGANIYVYLNGVQSTVNTNMGALAITDSTQVVAVGRNGAGNFEYLTGYVSNARIVKGTAVYTGAFTPPTLAPLTSAGSTSAAAYPSTTNVNITFASSATSLLTSQSNRFIDTSTNNFTITVNGDTAIKSFIPFTPNSSYSTYGSGYFDGTGDWLSVPDNVALQMSTSSFTIEFWINFSSIAGYQTIYNKGYNNAGSFSIQTDNGTGRPILYSAGVLILACTGSAASANTWIHYAIVRNSTTLTWYTNGVATGTTTNSTNFNNSEILAIAAGLSYTTYMVTGYISDLRVVKGTAVYTTAFTPPTAPLTAIANTSLLTLQNNQSVNNNVFLDNSTNNFLVTRNGNTTQGTFSPYGGNWSGYFNGTAGLSIPDSAAVQLGASDFTIEMWVYPTTTGGWWLVGKGDAASAAGSQISFYNGASNWDFYYGGNSLGITKPTLDLNVWQHIAVVRSSTIITIYKNGTSVSTGNIGANSLNTGGGNPFKVGMYSDAGILGYISNFRLVKGTAVYTGTFTPPTAPLAATQIAGTNIAAITNGATSLLTCQSNRFIDTSLNTFAVTVTGSTIQRFSPFNPSSVTPTSYSGYFDGTGDYLTVPDNVALQFATGDFTMELWFYPTATISSQILLAKGIGSDGFEFRSRSSGGGNYFSFWAANGVTAIVESSVTFTLNTWQHLAAVRSSGTITLYKNGVNVGSASNSQNFIASGSALRVAVDVTSGTAYSTGYISNIRIVKAVAVYTGAFTVPTSPLAATQTSGTNIAAITGTQTSLLTCQSTNFIDNSTNNFTITAAGNSQPTQQNPFGFTSALTNGYTASTIGGSGYFDGGGDYVLSPSNAAFDFGTGNFTIECWINPSALTSNRIIIERWVSGNTGGWQLYWRSTGTSLTFYVNATIVMQDPGATTISALNTWYHIAITRSGSTGYMFINGVLVQIAASFTTSLSSSLPLVLGIQYTTSTNDYNGYMSDVRLVKGTALYTSNFVPPSAPLTAVQNTTLLTNMTSAGIYNAAMMNNMETVGDAKLSTAVSKFGGTSMYFDGTGDRLNTSPGVINSLGSGDFTIEGWVYPSSLSSFMRILSQGTYTTGEFLFILYSNGSADFCEASTSRLSFSAGSFVVGAWEHFAIVRSGSGSNNLKGYINGTLAGTGTSSSYNFSATTAIYVGSNPTTSGQDFPGYIDDLRITKGFARYTANFTAPTTAFPIY